MYHSQASESGTNVPNTSASGASVAATVVK